MVPTWRQSVPRTDHQSRPAASEMARTQWTILRNRDWLLRPTPGAIEPGSTFSPRTEVSVAISSLLMEEPLINTMLADQILRTSLMPRPLVRKRRRGRSAVGVGQWGQQPAAI